MVLDTSYGINDNEDNEDKELSFVMTEDEYSDLERTIHELMYDILIDDALLYSDPDFHENILNDIQYLFNEDLIEANMITPDENIDDYISQIVETFFELYYPTRSITDSNLISYTDIEQTTQTIMVLKSLPQPTQKTTEWYEYRHNLLTASSIWKALSSESQRNSLIYEKCKPLADEKSNWFGGGSLQWGILYEMVSVMVYEKKYNTRVADFGCIQHINHSFIGASPDGINVDPKSDRYGRMIEIKNIVNRDITDKPKEEYWIQMQVQMETCDLDECDFIETRFKEYESPEAYADDINQESKGVILCFLQRNVPDSKPIYKYMPLDLDMTYQDWIINTKDDFKDTLVLYTTTYWYMDEFSCILVKRNPNWFQSALPTILTTWETILKERKTGYEHRAAKKREVTQENHNITNVIKLKKNTCLVKL
jgi:putative phage-type endonuclease